MPVSAYTLRYRLTRVPSHDRFLPRCQVVACTLIFVYNHLDQLGEPSRFEMLQWLHTRFGVLALHWSRVVRSIYMHVVVIKALNHEVLTLKIPAFHSPSPAPRPHCVLVIF